MRRRAIVGGLSASLCLGLSGRGLAAAMPVGGGPVTPMLVLGATRLLRFTWIPFEAGAPMVDPQRPFGSPDPMADLASLDATFAPADLRALYAAAMNGLGGFVAAAAPRLPPGRYALDPEEAGRLRSIAGQLADLGLPIDFGLAPDGGFAFTAEHAAILPRLRWSTGRLYDDAPLRPADVVARRDADTGETSWPVVEASPKRPYGEMTYAEADIAAALGIPVGADERGYAALPGAVEARLTALHHSTPAALRVLVAHGANG